MKTSWNVVVETYDKLSVSSRLGLERVGFVLIGAYSLDMHALNPRSRSYVYLFALMYLV